MINYTQFPFVLFITVLDFLQIRNLRSLQFKADEKLVPNTSRPVSNKPQPRCCSGIKVPSLVRMGQLRCVAWLMDGVNLCQGCILLVRMSIVSEDSKLRVVSSAQ